MAVRVTFTASSGATRYTVYRSTAAGQRGQAIAQPTASPYLDNNVAASTTYYYSVSASNLAGESAVSSPQASVTTPANPPPPTPQTINSFTALPNSITSGQTVTITWSTSNAASVTLNGSVVAASGSTTDMPTASKSYTLIASGSVANIQQTASVVVASVPPPTPQTITTFTALPASITTGQSVTITWATANATLVRLNGVTVASSGSTTVSPVANVNYTLLVSGSAPDISRTVGVTVTAAAQTITSFTATPSSIFAGTSATLAWTTLNAITATINGSSVGTSGSLIVSPATTTIYTLVITGTAAPVGLARTVTVQASAQTPPQWSTVPDIVFTQGFAATASLAPYVIDAQGDPFTLSVFSGTLPSGVTLNSSAKRLEYDGVGVVAQANGIVIAADDAFTPPPTPGDYMVPTYSELAFGDTRDVVFADEGTGHPSVEQDYTTGASYKSEPVYRDGRNVWPGAYCGGYTPEWDNIGGDWKDSAGTLQGNVPFASRAWVGAHQGEQTFDWNSGALTTLCQTWAGTAAKNYGLFLRSTANIIQFYSRFSATIAKRPVLIVTSTSQGTVNVPCGRSQWLVSSSSIPLFSPTELRVNGATDYALVWFDLSGFPSAGDITNVTLRLFSFDQWGSTSVNLFAVDNPGDQSGIGPIQYGIAAGYPGDVGMAADPNVLMFETFNDSSFFGTTAEVNAGLTRLNWSNSDWNVPNAGLQGDWVQADEPSNGFTKLNGTYNAWKVRYEKAQLSPGQGTPQPLSLDATFFPSKGPCQHIKPLQYCDELYFRYYLLLGANYDPLPQGGKAFGWTGRWTDIPGMGDGNGGSGCNGFTGFSVRGGFGVGNTASTSPLGNLRPLDWYCYNIDQQGAFGGSLPWNHNYLGWFRKSSSSTPIWYCIEQRIKMNSVTGEHTGAFTGQPALANGVATWTLSAPDTTLVSGNSLYISGVTNTPTGGPFNGGFFYTVIDSTHIAVTVGPNAGLPITGTPVYKTGIAQRDGILQCWVNGRLAASYTNLRFRASLLCTDGTTPFAVEGIWLNAYMGGICYPYDGPFEYYVSNMVVSKSYIGPMVTT